METITRKDCRSCKNFTWWDGDYCCPCKHEIFQNAPAWNSWLKPEILEKILKHTDCIDYIPGDFGGYREDFRKLEELVRLENEYLRQAKDTRKL